MTATSTTGTLVQPYLFFNGRTEEAIEFYKKTLGAEVEMMMRFSDSPEPMPEGKLPPGFENKIMHASFKLGAHSIMCSDGCGEDTPFNGFALSYAVKTAEEAERIFNALSSNAGQITMPLQQTFWTPAFGMLIDKFGLHWMISVITADCG